MISKRKITPTSLIPFVILALVFGSSSQLFAKTTLEDIKSRGVLRCGVRSDLSGFSSVNSEGKWTGLDADFCKAVASAVLGSPDKVDYVVLGAPQRLVALQNGDIDLLIRNTTWTYTRDTDMGLHFAGINFYDGQGFLAKKSLGAKELKQLPKGTEICVARNTTTILNLEDHLNKNDYGFKIKAYNSETETSNAFFSGRCQVLTTDRSALASARVSEAPNPDDYVILQDIISKEPLGPVVRDDDSQWSDIVRWVLFAQIAAEEQNINSANIDMLRKIPVNAKNPIAGAKSEASKALGLDNDWAYRVIRLVGNYAEVFERNLGADSEFALERGLNALWTQGGLMYSPPLR